MFNFDLIGKKYYFFALSIIIVLIGIISYGINGIQLDIQFQGGTMIEIQVPSADIDKDKAEAVVKEATGKPSSAQKLKTISGDKEVNMLMVSIASAQTLTGDEIDKTVSALRKEFNIATDASLSVQTVQPLIGKEMLGNSVKAIIWACVLIILYIWYRFRTMAHSGLSAALTAVIGLLHDALIMLTVYVVFKLPLNDAFIAAILTILGYSINDTIIIYDRIRENFGLMRKAPIAELVNKSIMQTMTRSINTVMTVLICILVVYIFSSVYNIATLKDFSFPLLIGIVSGSYSSIFICSPLWVMWKESRMKTRSSAKVAVKTR